MFKNINFNKKFFILLIPFLLITNSYASIGFFIKDTTPETWIYITNFLDLLILTIGSIIASFIYIYVLNPIMVPLLFLYLIYEIIKVLISMLKVSEENIHNNFIYNGKVLVVFVLKVIGLIFFFIGVPTGILVLSASKNDNTEGAQLKSLNQLFTAYKLNNPKPLIMDTTIEDMNLNTGIWVSVGKAKPGDFFGDIPLINILENNENAPANIKSGIFKVYLPAALAFPLTFAESFLYGSYNNASNSWNPGLLPSVFNNQDNGKVGIFSLLVYNPGLIYSIIFQQSDFTNAFKRGDIKSLLYKLAINRFNSVISVHESVNKISDLVNNEFLKIFLLSIQPIYMPENGITQINTFRIKNELKNIILNNDDIKQSVITYNQKLLELLNKYETEFLKKSYIDKNIQNLGFNTLKSILNQTDYTQTYIQNIKANWDADLNKLNTYYIGSGQNYFIKLPDLNNLTNFTDNSKNIIINNLLTVNMLPYIYLNKDNNLNFETKNILFDKKVVDNGNKDYNIINVLKTFLNTNITEDTTIKNLIYSIDLDQFENQHLFNVTGSSLPTTFTNNSIYDKISLNLNKNILGGYLTYYYYAINKILNKDIYGIVTNGKKYLYKDNNGNINNFIPPGENETNNQKFNSPYYIKLYYTYNTKAFLNATYVNFIKPDNIIPGVTTLIKEPKQINGLYINPLVELNYNVNYLINSLTNSDNLFYNLIKEIADNYNEYIYNKKINNNYTLLRNKVISTKSFLTNLLDNVNLDFQNKFIPIKTSIYNSINNYHQNEMSLFSNLVNNIVDIYLATYVKNNSTVSGASGIDSQNAVVDNNVKSKKVKKDDDNSIVQHAFSWIMDKIFALIKKFLDFIFGLFITLGNKIGTLLFGLLYSLHIVGVITILIIFPIKLLINIIFKNDYNEVFEAFKTYIGYRLIDFVYILMFYILGITFPILLFVLNKTFSAGGHEIVGLILTTFLTLFLMGSVFILTGKFIKITFDLLSANEGGLGLSGLFEKFGGGFNKISGQMVGFATTTASKTALGLGIKTTGSVGNFISNKTPDTFKNNFKNNSIGKAFGKGLEFTNKIGHHIGDAYNVGDKTIHKIFNPFEGSNTGSYSQKMADFQNIINNSPNSGSTIFNSKQILERSNQIFKETLNNNETKETNKETKETKEVKETEKTNFNNSNLEPENGTIINNYHNDNRNIKNVNNNITKNETTKNENININYNDNTTNTINTVNQKDIITKDTQNFKDNINKIFNDKNKNK